MSERVRLLIQAAREVRSAELRDKLLAAAEAESAMQRGRPRKRLTNPDEIDFPLPIFLNAPKQGDVEAELNADASVVLDGAVYTNPSSNDLMEVLGFSPGNAWPRWRFKTGDGQVFPIQVLRDHDPPLIQPSRKRRS